MKLLCRIGRFGSVWGEYELQEGVFYFMFTDTNATKKGWKESASVLKELYGQEKEKIYSTTFDNEYGEYEYKRPAGTEVMLLGVASGAVDEGVDEFLHGL